MHVLYRSSWKRARCSCVVWSSVSTSTTFGSSSTSQPLSTRATFRSSCGVLNTYAKALLTLLISQAPLSKIHCAASFLSAFACRAPPLRNECGVKSPIAPDGSATRFKKRLTGPQEALLASSSWTLCDTSSGSWLRREPHGASCVARATANARRGQVRKSALSGTSVRPCSSAVFTRSRRR
ncbi:hypothetical protein PHYSODRAFT_472871 [Phytophthora sojae]|uniref:Uncharacterized protein n=1 Tax=Phytophthora sojae (strain P6497) TaxID=1094619 RepID=G4YN48_PHYSP|nr:hypothetical protein PHYSODRAFT_472871 [Phytophthora sojae]EGZ29843.1 hypothetical protein PHYSODRAFT_472871 [Phytophthora sojae]|eukprot:XP_009517118.1 hypothetical protein PHYSODRAFT_472871 [Phytophthora sojae]